MTEGEGEEEENTEKTDADAERARKEEWGPDDRTEVDAQPPDDTPKELGKPR